jgi:glyoxylase-like metal-dependent hydrolase (beta-lactamase superfamily II)
MNKGLKRALVAAGLAVSATVAAPVAQAADVCSVWLVENSRFMNVPFGMFHPDRSYVKDSTNPRNNVNTVDLPVNVGVIKCGNELILYDNGWNATDYHKMTGTAHWSPLSQQIAQLGFDAKDVSKIIVGHGHWDHAGSLDEFPNAVLYIQKEELRGIEWALNYPGHERIRATNVDKGGCNRTPACGYPPKTVDSIYGKVLRGKANIVDGDLEILPGVKIHAAHRAHTAGSQLLEVPTSVGKLMFGSDAYSSWEAIRDWEVANIQQTDSVQQFLAYEKCYKVTGGYQNCVSAHEPLSYSDKYPLTKNAWVGMNGGRLAEIALAPGEKSRKK